MDNINNIIERIKALAKQQGITQTFLCKQIGKRPTYLNEVRLGKDRIHDNEIVTISAILNTTPAYLRGETDDPAPPKSDVMVITNASPRKRELANKILAMDEATLLKAEKILDMILEEK